MIQKGAQSIDHMLEGLMTQMTKLYDKWQGYILDYIALD